MEKIDKLIEQLETDIPDAYANELLLEKQDFQYDKQKHPFNIELTKESAKIVLDFLIELKQSRKADVSGSLALIEYLKEQLSDYIKIRDGWKPQTPQWEVYDLVVRQITKEIKYGESGNDR